MSATLPAAPAPTAELIYFVKCSGQDGWREATEEAYWTFSEPHRRILYAAPAPTEQASSILDPIVEANRALLHQRSQVGIRKYGTTLGDANLTERELIVHALEEALDLANYLQANLQRIDSTRGKD